MDFSHTPTFLRSAMLEDPFCLGDLLGPEDVLRIQTEYPDLFNNNNSASVVPKTSTNSAAVDRFARISQPKRTEPCARVEKVTPMKKEPVKKPPLPKSKSASVPTGVRFPAVQSQSVPNQTRLAERVKNVHGTQSAPYVPTNLAARMSVERLYTVRSKSQKFKLATMPKFIPTTSKCDDPTSLPKRNASSVPNISPRYTSLLTNQERSKASHELAKIAAHKTKHTEKSENSCARLRPVEAFKKHEKLDELLKARKAQLNPDARRKTALAKLDKIIFQLPQFQSPRVEDNVELSDISSQSSTLKSDESLETFPSVQDVIRIRSQYLGQPVDLDDMEEQLTRESMERCEQLLLTKFLAKKYEREGKLKKVQTEESPRRVSPKKKVRISSAAPSQIEIPSRDFLQSLKFKGRSRLEQEARDIIAKECERIVREECLQILGEWKEGKLSQTKDQKRNAVEKEVSSKSTSPTSSSSSVSDYSNKANDHALELSKSVSTPTLTPSSLNQKFSHIGCDSEKVRPKQKEYVDMEKTLHTPTVTASARGNLPTGNDPRMVDATDCSELEEFVASEVEIPERLLPTNEQHEPCITEVSTPNLSTRGSFLSEHRPTEKSSGGGGAFPQKNQVEVGLQVVSEEFNGKSFDMSEFESSLCSVVDVDVISEGELIGSEEKSPGEISNFMNVLSPGIPRNRQLSRGGSRSRKYQKFWGVNFFG